MSNIIVSPTSGVIEFNTGDAGISEFHTSTAPIRIDATGGNSWITGSSVGIGTTAPASELHVDGSITSTISQRVDTSTSYTFVIGDQSNIVACANGSAITATVPPNSDVAFPLGAELAVVQAGAGQVTLTAGAGVTLYAADSEVKTRVTYSMAYLYQSSANNWIVAGDLTS